MSSPSSPSPPPFPHLLSLQIRGGYFDGLDAPFASHVTCIIGGKGSGKSTLFESIRFAFAGSALAAAHDVRALLKKNLGAAGSVRVHFETKHGVRYFAERTLKDERPRFFTEDGQPAKLAPDAFPLEAYGQDEIETVGGDRASQLALLDRLAADELRPFVTEIGQVSERLRDGIQSLLALEEEIAGLEGDASEARAIDEQLKPLLAGTGGDAALLANAHAAKGARNREQHALKAATTALAEVRAQTETFAASMRRKLAAAAPSDARESGNANAELFARVNHELAAVAGAIEELTAGVGRRIDAAGTAIGSLHEKLSTLHAKDDAAYDALLARQKEDTARTSERARLQERHAVVARAVPILEERLRRHADLRRAQDALAARLAELRDLRGAVRARLETKLNTDLEKLGVRVSVNQAQCLDAYKAYLRDVFKAITGDQPKWLVDKVTSHLRPDELVAIVRAQDAARLVERAELRNNPERAAQAIAALTPNKHLYALQAMAIDDEAVIWLQHGVEWKDTVQCSPGQRCGAILPLLLLVGDRPLLIDQPDDNVEPDFLCNVVLPRVLSLRGARQFIFVTHHANVPVLSLSQEIIFIQSDGRSAQLEAHGDIDRMKAWILKKLEGGPDAFEARRRLYENTDKDRK